MKNESSRSMLYLRLAILGVGLLLPSLTLIPFGSIWLWQHGYLLYWAVAACLMVLAAYVVQFRLLGRATPAKPDVAAEASAPPDAETDAPDAGWTPREAEAWKHVLAIASTVTPDHVESSDEAMKLGLDTIRAVASTVHPEERDPLWKFTVPEALAILERVSVRMRVFVNENVPLGDRLTVAQMMAIYRWKGTIELAEKAYDLWRLARFINPLSAATHEVRERLSREMLQWGRDHIARRLAATYVKEIGRAAIDLYGGRLRVSEEALASHVTRASAADKAQASARVAEPLRILVAGQISAGKSSLINALAQEVTAAVDVLPTTPAFTAYELKRGGFPAALLIDSPGLGTRLGDAALLIENAAEADLVLWVVAAHRADRDADRRALQSFRLHFAERLNRRRPPVVLVVSHIDRLRPFQEWSPPYDLQSDRPKAVTIREAMSAIAEELGFSIDEAVGISTAPNVATYNIDAVWGQIVRLLPEAQSAQLIRSLHDMKDRWDWGRVWTQAANAGRVIVKTLRN
jgi:predicted GTPase